MYRTLFPPPGAQYIYICANWQIHIHLLHACMHACICTNSEEGQNIPPSWWVTHKNKYIYLNIYIYTHVS